MKPLKASNSYILLLIFLELLVNTTSFGQIRVTERRDLSSIVKQLEGPGVQISNVSMYIPAKAALKPIGYFEDLSEIIGLKNGLLITTGAAKFAEGPNSTESKYQQNYDLKKDPDLAIYSDSLFDVAYVEFDIVTSSSNLSFNYVFASEEYEEWLNYSDIFGFFIKGPGIKGSQNIGMIPGTSIPVRVGTINNTKNSQYYVSNTSSAYNIQYDGFTVPLKATAKVIPCEKYHIKLAIADYGDDKWDSGVFIEEGSFTSEDVPQLNVMYEHPNFSFAIEGCSKANIIIKRNPSTNDTISLKYDISLSGIAQEGIDFASLPDSVVIPKGQDSTVIVIDFIKDAIKEEEETLRLSILSRCPAFPDLAYIDVNVRDIFPYHVEGSKICEKAIATLNINPDPAMSFLWERDPGLSCTSCASPTVAPDSSRYYNYTITDLASGCSAHDSALVNVLKISADFAIKTEECYTSLDIFFDNNSTNGNTYLWTFGDGSTSEEKSPGHFYSYVNEKNALEFQVTLKVSSQAPTCFSEVTKTISITEPLFIPNLFTPGGDGKNDYLEIKGIGKQCWTLNLYNRWGTLVYQDNNYQNTFDGNNLVEGAYYYHLHNSMKDREYKGWVNLVRTPK